MAAWAAAMERAASAASQLARSSVWVAEASRGPVWPIPTPLFGETLAEVVGEAGTATSQTSPTALSASAARRGLDGPARGGRRMAGPRDPAPPARSARARHPALLDTSSPSVDTTDGGTAGSAAKRLPARASGALLRRHGDRSPLVVLPHRELELRPEASGARPLPPAGGARFSAVPRLPGDIPQGVPPAAAAATWPRYPRAAAPREEAVAHLDWVRRMAGRSRRILDALAGPGAAADWEAPALARAMSSPLNGEMAPRELLMWLTSPAQTNPGTSVSDARPPVSRPAKPAPGVPTANSRPTSAFEWPGDPAAITPGDPDPGRGEPAGSGPDLAAVPAVAYAGRPLPAPGAALSAPPPAPGAMPGDAPSMTLSTGDDEDELDRLAARIRRILNQEVRRHGISV